MKYIPDYRFPEYHNFHSMRISILAMPLMFIEMVTSIMLFYQNFSNAFHIIFFSNLIIVILIWFSTFLIQVPLHNSLSKEKDIEKLSRLVHTNWIRTILWTVRSALMISFLTYTIDFI